MHANIRALLDLHDVNLQRQRLIKDRRGREGGVAKATEIFDQADRKARDAEEKAASMDALIRQYTADIERCQKTITNLREKQMTAKTNKEYLAVINGVEEAKAEMKLRKESLNGLNTQVEELRQAAAAARAEADAVADKVDEAKVDAAGHEQANDSEQELERIYQEKKAAVEPELLDHYERLVIANHPMPMMRVDPASRATPMGTIISHNHLEQIRLGHMVLESTNKAILYVEE